MIAAANKSAASTLGSLYRMVRICPSYLSFSRPVAQNVHAETSSWRSRPIPVSLGQFTPHNLGRRTSPAATAAFCSKLVSHG
jgi:hypothetical protein